MNGFGLFIALDTQQFIDILGQNLIKFHLK
jgi:hypothetical protein